MTQITVDQVVQAALAVSKGRS